MKTRMKTMLMSLLICSACCAQHVKLRPSFPGGYKALQEFIEKDACDDHLFICTIRKTVLRAKSLQRIDDLFDMGLHFIDFRHTATPYQKILIFAYVSFRRSVYQSLRPNFLYRPLFSSAAVVFFFTIPTKLSRC